MSTIISGDDRLGSSADGMERDRVAGIPLDTTTAAYERQVRVWRSMTPSARVELAVAMTEDARAITRAGIARRHPEYSAAQVAAAFHRLLHGDELFRRAWPREPLLDP